MVFPGSDFVCAAPHEAGIPESAVSAALKHIAESHKDIHSMLILRGGKMVFEHYFDPYTRDTAHAMYSCSKTFTSMTAGAAVGKGLLKLTDRVVSFFPEVKYVNTPYLEQMTVRDLLCMGSGHHEDTFPNMRAAEHDWPSVFLNQPVVHEPGTHFLYNTGATYMVSAILEKITGRSTLDLLDEWILSKIGIDRPVWLTCPEGTPCGGTGLYLKPRDLARLGLLISNKGMWNGEQIIPAEYVEAASTAQIDNSRSGNTLGPSWLCGYGYQMWRCSFGAFRADGMGGQYIVMLPEKELVCVFTSALGSDIAYDLDIIEQDILPALSDAPVPAGEVVYPAARTLDPALLPELGHVYRFAENAGGLTSFCMEKDRITLFDANGMLRVPYGIGTAVLSEQRVQWMDWAPYNNVMTTVWSEDALYIRFNEFHEPATKLMKLTKTETGIHVDVTYTMGAPYAADGE